jgi:hypothetical protein
MSTSPSAKSATAEIAALATTFAPALRRHENSVAAQAKPAAATRANGVNEGCRRYAHADGRAGHLQ